MRIWSTPPEHVQTVLVTGGLGFIGSNFLCALASRFPGIRFVNLDAKTYAGVPQSVAAVEGCENYRFAQVDLRDPAAVDDLVSRERPDWVFHFAAETHVDRSIKYPQVVAETNVLGTLNLLEAARKFEVKLFHNVSTDEVFGSLGKEGAFSETTPYDPSSPYSASKAAADHLVRAYSRTYKVPTVITNCSNNYGPRQFPEKLMPVMILAAAEGRPLPVYGDGSNIRDWLYVEDHAHAIWEVANRGKVGETYCIGGATERSNLEIVSAIAKTVASRIGKPEGEVLSQIKFVEDRPGHDWRYAIDMTKIKTELGWEPAESMETGLAKTVEWYLSNPAWIEAAKSQEYDKWMTEHYQGSGAV